MDPANSVIMDSGYYFRLFFNGRKNGRRPVYFNTEKKSLWRRETEISTTSYEIVDINMAGSGDTKMEATRGDRKTRATERDRIVNSTTKPQSRNAAKLQELQQTPLQPRLDRNRNMESRKTTGRSTVRTSQQL